MPLWDSWLLSAHTSLPKVGRGGHNSEVTFPTVARSLTALSATPHKHTHSPDPKASCFEPGPSEIALLALPTQVLQATVPHAWGKAGSFLKEPF